MLYDKIKKIIYIDLQEYVSFFINYLNNHLYFTSSEIVRAFLKLYDISVLKKPFHKIFNKLMFKQRRFIEIAKKQKYITQYSKKTYKFIDNNEKNKYLLRIRLCQIKSQRLDYNPDEENDFVICFSNIFK